MVGWYASWFVYDLEAVVVMIDGERTGGVLQLVFIQVAPSARDYGGIGSIVKTIQMGLRLPMFERGSGGSFLLNSSN